MVNHLDRIGQQVGDYRLLQWLGGGGFGNVYMAEQVDTHQHIAVKLLQIRLTSSDELKAFINEARTIRLKHPHIVPLLDFGISREEIPFLVMEYAAQGTLRDRYPKGTQVPLTTAVSYVQQIASALQYAHEQRLIHRDVKPENMLLRADGSVLLSDFGIVAVAHSSHSLSLYQGIGGTIPYMAPEQIQGRARAASDQYSLGVVFYEWIAGRRPFEGTAAEIAIQHVMQPPTSLVDQVPTLSRAVDQAVLKALAKDPRDRFATVRDFAAALAQATRRMPDTFPSALPYRPPSRVMPNIDRASPIGSRERVLSLYPSSSAAPSSRPSPPVMSPPVTSPHHSEPSLLLAMTEIGSPAQSAFFSPHSDYRVPPPPPVPSASNYLSVGQSFMQPLDQALQPPPSIHRSNQSPDPSKMKTTLLIGLVCVVLLGSLSLFSPSIIRWLIPQGKGAGSPTALPSAATTGTPVYPPAVTDFTMFGFDPQHTHFNPLERTLNAGNVSRLRPGWVNKTGRGIVGSPIIAHGIVYVGSDKLYAFDARTGKTVWTASLDSHDPGIEASPAFADGMVYVGGGKLYAFNAQTGQRVWTASVGKYPYGDGSDLTTYDAPTIVNGVVYIASTDTYIKMYAFDAKSGKQLWAAHTNGIILSSPAVVDNIVYIGTYNGLFYALDAKTGATIWTASITDPISPVSTLSYAGWAPIYSSPTVVNNTVYVGNDGGKVHAFNAKTGQTLWSTTNLGGYISSPAFAEGALYVNSTQMGVYKLNASTGQVLWNAKSAGGDETASPTIANGVVYIGTYAFDTQTGARLWSAPTTDGAGEDYVFFYDTPIIANGVVYVGSGSNDGKLLTYYLPS